MGKGYSPYAEGLQSKKDAGLLGAVGGFSGAPALPGVGGIDQGPLKLLEGMRQVVPQGQEIAGPPEEAAAPLLPAIGDAIGSIDPAKAGGGNLPNQPGKGGGGGMGAFQGTLGIINMGAGIGGQIAKMAMRKKPQRPPARIPMPGGNPFR